MKGKESIRRELSEPFLLSPASFPFGRSRQVRAATGQRPPAPRLSEPRGAELACSSSVPRRPLLSSGERLQSWELTERRAPECRGLKTKPERGKCTVESLAEIQSN